MIYVQVITEVEVDEEAILDNFRPEWDAFGGVDPAEFLAYLVATNEISVDDLGEVAYQYVMPI